MGLPAAGLPSYARQLEKHHGAFLIYVLARVFLDWGGCRGVCDACGQATLPAVLPLPTICVYLLQPSIIGDIWIPTISLNSP
jgi:hypothetical protein